MPVPSRERVIELISELVHAQGYDVDDVVVTSAGKHSAVRIMVDSDAGIELDAAALVDDVHAGVARRQTPVFAKQRQHRRVGDEPCGSKRPAGA